MTTAAPSANDQPSRVVLGLDVGTTATKVAAFGLDLAWRHATSREYPLLEPAPGQQTQDPAQIGAAVDDALAECVAACRGADIVGVSVSTAMHGLLGLDAALAPVTPLVTWADARAHAEARELRRSELAGELHRSTGTPIHPMSPLLKLAWFSRHEPELAASVRWWVGLKDYVLWLLTGEIATELSSASATGLLAIREGTWHLPALDLAGIRVDQLPTLLPTSSTLALSDETSQRTGLPRGTPIVVGAADGPLGNLGTGAMAPGILGLSLGTSGAVRALVDQPPTNLDESLFCYNLADEAWTVGGAVSNGGIVVRWAGASLAPDIVKTAAAPDAALLELVAGVPPGSDGLVMLPYLLAERAPLWDPDLHGAYLGLRRDHTRAHMIRAAVEGVCLQLSKIVDQLDRLEPVTSVRVTGGAFQSTLWKEVLAATLDRPLTIVGHAEGSALGAAALGLVALGLAPSLVAATSQLAPPGTEGDQEVRPDPMMAETYAATRRSIPALIDELSAVRRLFAHQERAW